MAGAGRQRLAALFRRRLNTAGGFQAVLPGEIWSCPISSEGSLRRTNMTSLMFRASACDKAAPTPEVEKKTARPQPPYGGLEWAVRKVEEKRATTKYLTTSEFMRMWNDANLGSGNGDKLARELLRQGVVMKLGNTIFLDGENVAASVDVGVPDCPIEVQNKLKSLEAELEPLEKLKKKLDGMAFTRSKRLLMAGLGGMITQFAVFSRLTFWDSSWDVIEPITYFTTLTLTMCAYLYFLKTKQKFRYINVYNTVGDRNAQRLYAEYKLDYKKYRKLKDEVERWRRYTNVKGKLE